MKFTLLSFLDHTFYFLVGHRLTGKCVVGFKCFGFPHNQKNKDLTQRKILTRNKAAQ